MYLCFVGWPPLPKQQIFLLFKKKLLMRGWSTCLQHSALVALTIFWVCADWLWTTSPNCSYHMQQKWCQSTLWVHNAIFICLKKVRNQICYTNTIAWFLSSIRGLCCPQVWEARGGLLINITIWVPSTLSLFRQRLRLTSKGDKDYASGKSSSFSIMK